jgi:hypothetical protein
VWLELVARNPSLNGVGEWGNLARLDKREELLVGDMGARPVRHRGSKFLGGQEARAAALLQMRKISEHGGKEREEEEEDEKAKSQTSARHGVLKGAGATPHL